MSGHRDFPTREERIGLPGVMRKRKAEAPGNSGSVGLIVEFPCLGSNTTRARPPEFHGRGLASVDPAAYPERESGLRKCTPCDINRVGDTILRPFATRYSRAGTVKPKSFSRRADRQVREKSVGQSG